MKSLGWEKWLGLTTAAALVATMYGALLWAPMERTMGDVQRIFYVHVPSFWSAFTAYFVVSAASAAYLATRNAKWDRVALASAEVGTVLCTAGLITGPIWAKPVWGVWWVWDPRLTLSFLVWLIYVAYLLLRDFIEEPARRATFAAVYGVLAVGAVIFDYLAIRLWRTQHPQPVVMGGEGSGLDPQMYQVLGFSGITFLVLFILLAVLRVRLERAREEVRLLQRQMMLES
jgi:heme exporter protein C